LKTPTMSTEPPADQAPDSPAAEYVADPLLKRKVEYIYHNAPYEQFCEMGRSVYAISGKALVKFIQECKHKKSGLALIADEAAATDVAQQMLLADYIHAVMPSPDGRPNWYQPIPRGPFVDNFVRKAAHKYVWNYKESRTKQLGLLGLLVFVCIGVCLFPVWPMWMKRGLHFILVTLLAVIIVLLVLRGLLFSSVWFFGYELWVLPNVLSEDEGVDMFKPLVTFKRSKGVRNWHRALAVVFLALMGYWIATQPSDFERLLMAQQQFVSNLYSGSLLGDANQADRDRAANAGGIDDLVDENSTAGNDTEPNMGFSSTFPESNVRSDDERAAGSVQSDYDHLDFEPDVPLGEDEDEVEVGAGGQ